MVFYIPEEWKIYLTFWLTAGNLIGVENINETELLPKLPVLLKFASELR